MMKKPLFVGSSIILMGLLVTQFYGYFRYRFFPSNPIFLIQSFPSSSFLEKTLTAEDGLGGVAIAPNGKTLASGGKEKIKLWNLANGKLIRSFPGGTNLDASFSPDGNILATVNLASSEEGKGIPSKYKGYNIKLWDVFRRKEIRTLQTEYDENLTSFAFSPNGNVIASSGANKLSTKQPKATALKVLNQQAFIPTNQTIKLWDIRTGEEIRTLNAHENNVQQVVFSPNGKILASTSLDNTIKLWDLETGQEIQRFKGRGSFAISPDGNILVANYYDSNSSDTTIKLWDLNTYVLICEIPHENSLGIDNLTISPDGKTIAGSNTGGTTILLWDAVTGKQIQTFLGHSKKVAYLAFTRNGKQLISGSYDDQTIKIWRLPI